MGQGQRNLFVRLAVVILVFFSAFGACQAQSLTVSPSPSALTIFPGQQKIPITVAVAGTEAGQPVTVTLTGLPTGITVTPATLTADGSATVYLNASPAAGQEGFPAGASSVVQWTAAPTIVAASGASQATAAFALTISISNPAFVPSTVNLPIVKINTNGVPIVSKTTDVAGTITITSADGQTSYLPNSSDTDNTATFHVRGHTTAQMPKLPYHIKLNTSLDLLGTMGVICPYITSKGAAVCDKSKTYNLLANYDDKTFVRDWAASALANAIPMGNGYLTSPAGSPSPSGTSTLMPWAAHSLFVELYLNGVYEGNYQLIEEVKVDSHRLNITELSETDTTDDITGGYLLEVDQHEDEAYVFKTPAGLPIGLVDPDFTPDPEVPQQTSYISNYVDTAETALYSSNFTDPTLGWRAYFDETAAVNYYIVNDLMGNVDGGDFYSSVYLYKAIDNPLLYMGPVWDFDISAGNVNYQPITDPTVPWTQTQAAWYTQWFKDPGFKADVATQWNALKNNGVLSTWLASIPTEAATLEQSQANNFGRWPMQGIKVWPNAEAVGSYDGEVQYLTTWLQLRMAYLDSIFNNKAATTTALTATGGFRYGVASTLSAQVIGGSSPTGVVTFLANGIAVGSATLGAGGVASTTTSVLPVGSDSLRAVYNGDANNALSASSPATIIVEPPRSATTVSVAGTTAIVAGGRATFTAAVLSDQGSPAPTGTVTFALDNGTTVSAKLNAGQTATTSLIPSSAGTHTLTATYLGDASNSTSSGTTTIAVAAPPGISVSGTDVSLTAGAASGNTSTITVTPSGGFTGAVTLSAAVTTSPAGASKPPTFSFGSTSPVTIGSGAATATLTISTTAPTTTTTGSSPQQPLRNRRYCLRWPSDSRLPPAPPLLEHLPWSLYSCPCLRRHRHWVRQFKQQEQGYRPQHDYCARHHSGRLRHHRHRDLGFAHYAEHHQPAGSIASHPTGAAQSSRPACLQRP